MIRESGFYRGINLGGWMSQCDYSKDRLDHFITEEDFKIIADWGLDHVRIPVDYNVIQEKNGALKEDGFERIERAVSWCEKNGLKAVLDLHKTLGFSFDKEEGEGGFFENERYQEYFYAVWEAFAKRFGDLSGKVAFELLNEVTEEAFLAPWMKIAKECVQRIRAYAKETDVLVGSYHHNGAREVQYMEAPFDEHVIYNFHCYEPLKFTHQGAHWDTGLNREDRFSFEESGASEDYFEELFSTAIQKAGKEGTVLYCGEYGVIDIVSPEEALKWFKAIHAVFEQHKIARAVWSYRQMDFGISDPRMDMVRRELIENL